jgi:hypothetical protein
MSIDFSGFDNLHLLGEERYVLASTALDAPCGASKSSP